jgi:hypothetical protein
MSVSNLLLNDTLNPHRRLHVSTMNVIDLHPVRHTSAVFRRGRHCLLSSVCGQLSWERRRRSDHRLIPTNHWLPSTVYQITSPYVSMDRHRHPCNERAVTFIPTKIMQVNIVLLYLSAHRFNAVSHSLLAAVVVRLIGIKYSEFCTFYHFLFTLKPSWTGVAEKKHFHQWYSVNRIQ